MRNKYGPLEIGQIFHRWTVVSGVAGSQSYYVCRCDCGTEKHVQRANLLSGMSQSCGCLCRERTSLANRTHHESHKSAEHHIWCAMKGRCNNPRDHAFDNYGGRGITVCERWINSYETFLEDMGRRPSTKHSIDRINNELGYSPDNCRWADRITQANNRRTNRLLSYNGQTHTLNEWAVVLGVDRTLIKCRLKAGWSIEDAFNKPTCSTGQYEDPLKLTAFGESKTIAEWLKDDRCVATRAGINHRIARGWEHERALMTPSRKMNIQSRK